MGRQTSKVDFNLSGELERSIQVAKNQKSTVIGFLKDKEYDKASGLERKFGEAVFTLSDKEVDQALDRVEKELDRILDKTFG